MRLSPGVEYLVIEDVAHITYSIINVTMLISTIGLIQIFDISCFHSFLVGDGREGYPPEAPYDAIHVGAAAATLPKAVR